MIGLYRLATRLAGPFLPAYLRRRARRGKETKRSQVERLGRYAAGRPDGPLVWMHGASLGETTALLPLVERILAEDPARHVLMTSQTVSSASLLSARLPDRAQHAFAPLDTPTAVARCLDHWRPDAVIIAESEVWPNLLLEIERRGIPVALVNARMNAESLARWRQTKAAARVFGIFDAVLAADAATAKGLSEVAGMDVEVVGNTKFAALPPAPDAQAVDTLKAKLAGARTVAVLSLHPEESAEVAAWARTLPEDVRLVVVPRYPDRMDAYGNLRRERVHILPGFGTTALACAVAKCAFVGGSLQGDLKGHNPVEAMHLGLPVASGPHVASFADIYAEWFDDAGIAPGLGAIERWLSDGDALAEASDRARRFAERYGSVTDDVMHHLRPLLPSPR